MTNEERVRRWEQRTEVPLVLLALAFLVAYAWPVLDPRLEPDVATTLRAVSWAVWAAFATDLVVRLALARHRARYAWRHWYDVVLVALPVLRPLRLLQLLAFARLLQRGARVTLVGRVGVYVGGATVAAIGLGALAVLDAEQEAAGATITSYGDALWWACTTVTTVGYGDLYPVTTGGRLVAVVLMFVGVALVGTVTATAAAWLVRRLQVEDDEADEREAAREAEQAREARAASRPGENADPRVG